MTKQVIFVDETAEIGGAEIIFVALAEQLREIDWASSAVLPREGPLSTLLNNSGIEVCKISRLPFLSTSFYIGNRHKIPNLMALPINLILGAIWLIKLYNFFNRSQPIIVQTVSIWSHIFAGIAARLAGCPVVWHFQSIVSPSSGWGLYRKLLSLGAIYVPSRIICLSKKISEQFGDDPIVKSKIDIIWPAIDLGKFFPSESAENAELYEEFVITIGTAARLTPWKGQEIAIKAAQILKNRGIRFRWLFAGNEALGSQGYQAHLLNLTQQLGLEPDVEFVGWVADMAGFYKSIDILVHVPIEPEPFGMVLTEAMASALPVIATSGGGIEDLVEAAGGVLVPPHQPEAIADALTEFCQSQQKIRETGKLARCFASQAFSKEKYIQRWVEVYNLL